MACTLTVEQPIGRATPSQLTVSGTVTGACQEVTVQVFQLQSLGDTPPANPYATGTATVVGGLWTVTLDIDGEIHCKYPLHVAARCSGGDDCRHDAQFAVDCLHCPDLALLDVVVDDACSANPFGDLVREITVRVRAGFQPPLAPPVMAEVALYLPQVPHDATPPASSEVASEVVQFAASGQTADAVFTVRAGFDYAGRVRVFFPEGCAVTVPFLLRVPACDCPPGPSGGLTVTGPDGAPLTDPELCVDGATIVVCAPSYPTDPGLVWSTDPEVALEPVTGSPRCVSVALPASGERVHVYARLGSGQCTYDRIISARRCVPQPPGGGGTVPPPVVPGGGVTPEEPTNVDLCTIFNVMFLLGLGLLALGLALTLCPPFGGAVIPPQYMFLIGIGVSAIGAALALLFGLLWLFFCRPSLCQWKAVLWKIAFLAAVVFIYLGFCPACATLGFGAGITLALVAIAIFIWWIRECRPTTCGVFNELVLLIPAFDVVGLLEILLGQCVITSNPLAAGLYAAFLVLFTTVAIAGQQMSCRID